MEYLFSIIRNIGFKRTSEAFLFGAVLKDCANRGVDVDTVGTKLFEYMDEERIMDIYTIVMFLFGLLLFELVLLLSMELYSRISDWWWKFRFNGRID